MRRIHIIGRKNSGKTTLITELVQYLTSQGKRVGTVKHTHHDHELDTPGKDSYLHRQAGAEVVGILSPQLNAIFYRPDQHHDAPDRYETFAAIFDGCDLVLVEGHSQADAPKVEVWRAATETPPMAESDPSIRCVITDDPLDLDIPVTPRHDIPALASQLLNWVDNE